MVENFPPPLGCVPFSDWLKYGVTDFILNPLPSNLNRYSQTEREAPGVRLPPDPKAGRQITHRISIHPFSVCITVTDRVCKHGPYIPAARPQVFLPTNQRMRMVCLQGPLIVNLASVGAPYHLLWLLANQKLPFSVVRVAVNPFPFWLSLGWEVYKSTNFNRFIWSWVTYLKL